MRLKIFHWRNIKGWFSTLLRDIERKFKEENSISKHLIVSGDVADCGMPKEYQKAEEFLDLLIEGIIESIAQVN
jgi:3',5'-cyclic AMP phosphodiesterase CpdA